MVVRRAEGAEIDGIGIVCGMPFENVPCAVQLAVQRFQDRSHLLSATAGDAQGQRDRAVVVRRRWDGLPLGQQGRYGGPLQRWRREVRRSNVHQQLKSLTIIQIEPLLSTRADPIYKLAYWSSHQPPLLSINARPARRPLTNDPTTFPSISTVIPCRAEAMAVAIT